MKAPDTGVGGGNSEVGLNQASQTAQLVKDLDAEEPHLPLGYDQEQPCQITYHYVSYREYFIHQGISYSVTSNSPLG